MKLPEVSVNGAIGNNTSHTSSSVSLTNGVNAITLFACFNAATAFAPSAVSISGSTLSSKTACFGAFTISTTLLPEFTFKTSAPTLLAACGKMPSTAPVASASSCAAA